MDFFNENVVDIRFKRAVKQAKELRKQALLEAQMHNPEMRAQIRRESIIEREDDGDVAVGRLMSHAVNDDYDFNTEIELNDKMTIKILKKTENPTKLYLTNYQKKGNQNPLMLIKGEEGDLIEIVKEPKQKKVINLMSPNKKLMLVK